MEIQVVVVPWAINVLTEYTKTDFQQWSKARPIFHFRIARLAQKFVPIVSIRPEQYHFFDPNTNTQYFQRGLNQYQYQFFEEYLTIPNTNIHEGS